MSGYAQLAQLFCYRLRHRDAKISISNINKQIFVADIYLITYISLISFMDFIDSYALITHLLIPFYSMTWRDV